MARARGYYQQLVAGYFNDATGKPFKLTNGQADLFKLVYEPEYRRVGARCVTQYGKSDVTAMALDKIATEERERREKMLIVSPSEKQSGIIMGYVIQHLFDHECFRSSIEFHGSLERLRAERSKRRITFKGGSEIFILTAIARELSKEATNLMGFGATMVVVDERGLLPQSMYNKILRMVGGTQGKIVQLGNPFPGNGFERVFDNPRYETLTVDDKQALAEGRVTREFLDEARDEYGGEDSIDYTIFYKCEFPKVGAENAVIPKNWIDLAVNQEGCEGEELHAGLDVARFGRDLSVYCLRKGGKVFPLKVMEKMDTMELVGWLRGILDDDEPESLKVDLIGIGAGVNDRLSELEEEGKIDVGIEGVNVGASPSDVEAKEKFLNLRAEVFWNLRNWFKPNKKGRSRISIPDDAKLIKELSEIRYKYSSERKIKIEPKQDMKKRLGYSPDRADSLALAFYEGGAITEDDMMIAEV
jgi:hypothetical protein